MPAVRRTIFIPSTLRFSAMACLILSLCKTLFYVPFFMLGALAFINLESESTVYHAIARLHARRRIRICRIPAQSTLHGNGDAGMYETEYVITMVMGLWMVNVVFAWPPFTEFPVGSRDLFCQRVAVHLFGAPPVNAVLARISHRISSRICWVFSAVCFCGWNCGHTVRKSILRIGAEVSFRVNRPLSGIKQGGSRLVFLH